MGALGLGPSTELDSTFGAFLIGVFFAIFFQGLLTVQTWNYFENFSDDRRLLKALVLWVWVLDTVHLVIICQTIYHYLVTNWGYQPALVKAIPELTLHILFIGLASFSCQMFFLIRIWVFSRKNKVVCGFVLAICIATLGLNIHLPLQLILGHYSIPQLADVKPETLALFLAGALSDVLIAGLLCYYLQFTDRKSNFQATRSVIGRILGYVVVTGLLTSFLGIAATISFLIKPHQLYYIAIHLLLGRLYTNSLLATLNARKKIRETLRGSDGAGRPQIDTVQSRRQANVIPLSQSTDIRVTVEHCTTRQDDYGRNEDSLELKRMDMLTSNPHHSLA